MEASRRALELEPLLPEAHVARACLLSMEGKDAAAAQDFEQAIRLNPTAYYTHYLYARHLFAIGRIAESVRMYAEADRLQPGDYQVLGCTTVRCASRAMSRASRKSQCARWTRSTGSCSSIPTMRGRCSSGR